MKRIYLAGYSQETEYRKHVKKTYSNELDLFDPMSEIDSVVLQGLDLNNLDEFAKSEIVESDKIEILKSDILVAYIKQYSAGTTMEIMHAHNHGIPVYIVSPDRKIRNDIWLSYHSNKIYSNLDDCFKAIIKE